MHCSLNLLVLLLLAIFFGIIVPCFVQYSWKRLDKSQIMMCTLKNRRLKAVAGASAVEPTSVVQAADFDLASDAEHVSTPPHPLSTIPQSG
jgi:hypothetical protein